MSTVGKTTNQRASKRVKYEDPRRSGASLAQSRATAAYIADLCGELAIMAKRNDLMLVAHFLAMAQAEALYVID